MTFAASEFNCSPLSSFLSLTPSSHLGDNHRVVPLDGSNGIEQKQPLYKKCREDKFTIDSERSPKCVGIRRNLTFLVLLSIRAMGGCCFPQSKAIRAYPFLIPFTVPEQDLDVPIFVKA